MARSPPNFHKMDSRSACIQGVVKVKGHVIRALLCWHENRFFSQANGPIATKLPQDGLQVSLLHPGCAQGQGQWSRDMGTFVLARKSLLLQGKWPDRGQTCTQWLPGKSASRVCSRSKVTWYAHFLGFLEWATPSLMVWFLLECNLIYVVLGTWIRVDVDIGTDILFYDCTEAVLLLFIIPSSPADVCGTLCFHLSLCLLNIQ